MTTKELTNNLAATLGITKKQAEHLLSTTTEVMVDALQKGECVQLQNFGTLETKERAARQVTNPKTGERMLTRAKSVISFRPNETLKEQVK